MKKLSERVVINISAIVIVIVTAVPSFAVYFVIVRMVVINVCESPIYFPLARWQAEEPYICFETRVLEQGKFEYWHPGEMEYNGKIIEVHVSFDEFGNGMSISDLEGNLLLSGSCISSSRKCLYIINKRIDGLLSDEYRMIVFEKVKDLENPMETTVSEESMNSELS